MVVVCAAAVPVVLNTRALGGMKENAAVTAVPARAEGEKGSGEGDARPPVCVAVVVAPELAPVCVVVVTDSAPGVVVVVDVVLSAAASAAALGETGGTVMAGITTTVCAWPPAVAVCVWVV